MAITVKSAPKWFDLGLKMDEADLENGDVIVTGCVVPFAGEVTEVWVGTQTLPTAGTLAVHKAGATAVNLLEATTVDLAALTAYTGTAQTLSTNKAKRIIAAGNILKAIWTLTTITASDDAIFSCMVKVQPSYQ